MGTAPQGSRGWQRGLLGRAWEGLGGGPGRKAPSADWNKVALGALIDLARCSGRQPGGASAGQAAGFPRCGDTLGERLFMWLWGKPATQHVGEARALGGVLP